MEYHAKYLYDTHVNRQHRKHASYYISKKHIGFAETFSSNYYSFSLFFMNENIEHEINNIAYVSGLLVNVCMLFFFGKTFRHCFDMIFILLP